MERSLDLATLQKMIFVYNAVENGWTVKRLHSRYQFTKPTENAKEEVFDDDFPANFLRSFASPDHFFARRKQDRADVVTNCEEQIEHP